MAGSLGIAVLATSLTIAQQPAGPGDALPGLSATEFEEFRHGLTDFLEVETAEDGLGPAYNATSCAVCGLLFVPILAVLGRSSSRINRTFEIPCPVETRTPPTPSGRACPTSNSTNRPSTSCPCPTTRLTA